MDRLRITLFFMTKVFQARRLRRRHSLVFWYLLPLLCPISVNAADPVDAVNATDADTADTVVSDAPEPPPP